MYLATLSKHLHVNSDQLMIQLRSMTCASLSESTMSIFVDPMARDNLGINIIAHDRNLIIMILS